MWNTACGKYDTEVMKWSLPPAGHRAEQAALSTLASESLEPKAQHSRDPPGQREQLSSQLHLLSQLQWPGGGAAGWQPIIQGCCWQRLMPLVICDLTNKAQGTGQGDSLWKGSQKKNRLFLLVKPPLGTSRHLWLTTLECLLENGEPEKALGGKGQD